MRRAFEYILLLFALMLGGCAQSIDVPATQTAMFATALIEIQTEIARVTNTPAPQPTPEPKEPTIAPEITSTESSSDGSTPLQTSLPTGPVIFEDQFDSVSADWETVWVTTFTENLSKSTVGADQGWIFFDLKDKATMIYSFYKSAIEKNVVIETVNDIDGPGQTEVSVVCRASSDYSSWIDFRIFYFNEYAIYAYNRSPTSAGENPYTELIRAPFSGDLIFPGENNLIRATCDNNTFSLELNGTQLGSVKSDKVAGPGLVGVGAISPMNSQTAVWFDYVKVVGP